MSLTLGSGITFHNGIISTNWLRTTNISISSLKMHLHSNQKITPNAFNSSAFEYLESLTLQHVTANRLSVGIFNGLKSIKEIQFFNANINEFENGILDGLQDTLNSFTMIGSTQRKAIAIDGLTSMGQFGQHSLRTLTIRQNLSRTLRTTTFRKIIALNQLNLSHCEIEVIPRKIFDKLGSGLATIDLSGNKLKTLPGDLFDILFNSQRSTMTVYVGDNPWHCDCDLREFQSNIRKHVRFHGRIQCETPAIYKGTDVERVSLCDTRPTSRTSSTHSLADDYTVLQECNSMDGFLPVETIDIQCRSQLIVQIDSANGTVGLELQYVTADLVVVWFDNRTLHQRSNGNDSATANCVMPDNRLVYLDNLMPDMVYTACLMQKHSTVVSPLDCLSFSTIAQEYEPPVWLTDRHRGLTVGLSVCGILVFVLFGLMMGYWILRRFPIFLRHNKRIVVMNKSFRNNEVLVMPPEWLKQKDDDRDNLHHEMDNNK